MRSTLCLCLFLLVMFSLGHATNHYDQNFFLTSGSLSTHPSEFDQFARTTYGVGGIDTKSCSACTFSNGILTNGKAVLDLKDTFLKGAVITATKDGFIIKKRGSFSLGEKKQVSFTLKTNQKVTLKTDGTVVVPAGVVVNGATAVTQAVLDTSKHHEGSFFVKSGTFQDSTGKIAKGKNYNLHVGKPINRATASNLQGNHIFLGTGDSFLIKGVGTVITNTNKPKVVYDGLQQGSLVWTDKKKIRFDAIEGLYKEKLPIGRFIPEVWVIRNGEREKIPLLYSIKKQGGKLKVGMFPITSKLGDIAHKKVTIEKLPGITVSLDGLDLQFSNKNFLLGQVTLKSSETPDFKYGLQQGTEHRQGVKHLFTVSATLSGMGQGTVKFFVSGAELKSIVDTAKKRGWSNEKFLEELVKAKTSSVELTAASIGIGSVGSGLVKIFTLGTKDIAGSKIQQQFQIVGEIAGLTGNDFGEYSKAVSKIKDGSRIVFDRKQRTMTVDGFTVRISENAINNIINQRVKPQLSIVTRESQVMELIKKIRNQ